MQISTKFTIAIHVLAAVDFFGKDRKVTSGFLAASIGSNPVIIRNIMSDLQDAGIIATKRGPGGIEIVKPLDRITFYDVYEAVEKNKDHLFNFHDNPNPACPVGRNIHDALDGRLADAQNNFENDLKRYNMADVLKDIREDVKEQEPAS
ncbi:MAG: Rrf2 family transcriptional regulator [Lachnospiraceae bacterium]|nr:Rrf2 family transcriptional regulator [Lachnospiraceae bacterium]MDD7327560.1 Rrf2 family transcriptional regulator [Lachnospiraceae bacterium]MDY2758499.1 Rrf2 family transcriptional regulator [Lachnospiraceae bacterium]